MYAVGVTELLTYCLDMLKNRVGVMKIDTRKTFISGIITGLIERTTDAKLMKALCKVSCVFKLPYLRCFFCFQF